jgi:shikimate kinase
VRVFLVGFMGCGKSSVGPELARRLAVPFLDLDLEIARRAGRSIPDLFAEEGERAFRQREREALVASGEIAAAVIATGGGCPVEPANRAWMREHGCRVWLRLPWPALARRLAGTGGERPLWRSGEEARRLYERRLHAYEDCDLEIAIAAHEAPETVAGRIFELLGAAPDLARPRPL